MKTTLTREEEGKMIPYVLLQRCSLEEINSYKPKNSVYSTDSNSDPWNKNDHVLPYVLLERLSPNVIDKLLANTRQQNTRQE